MGAPTRTGDCRAGELLVRGVDEPVGELLLGVGAASSLAALSDRRCTL